jgi:hypothetical protein
MQADSDSRAEPPVDHREDQSFHVVCCVLPRLVAGVAPTGREGRAVAGTGPYLDAREVREPERRGAASAYSGMKTMSIRGGGRTARKRLCKCHNIGPVCGSQVLDQSIRDSDQHSNTATASTWATNRKSGHSAL